jgi:hypothetical protein
MTDLYPDIPRGDAPLRPNGTPTGDGAAEGASVGQLVAEVARDVSLLAHQEIALAKAELREEVNKAGKSAGMFAGAGGAGYFALLFGLLAAMFGLAEVMATAWAAAIIMFALLLVAAGLGLRGRSTARSLHPAPTRTVQTLKEDVQWARHIRG